MECLANLSLKDAPEEIMDVDVNDLRLDTLPSELLLHILTLCQSGPSSSRKRATTETRFFGGKSK